MDIDTDRFFRFIPINEKKYENLLFRVDVEDLPDDWITGQPYPYTLNFSDDTCFKTCRRQAINGDTGPDALMYDNECNNGSLYIFEGKNANRFKETTEQLSRHLKRWWVIAPPAYTKQLKTIILHAGFYGLATRECGLDILMLEKYLESSMIEKAEKCLMDQTQACYCYFEDDYKKCENINPYMSSFEFFGDGKDMLMHEIRVGPIKPSFQDQKPGLSGNAIIKELLSHFRNDIPLGVASSDRNKTTFWISWIDQYGDKVDFIQVRRDGGNYQLLKIDGAIIYELFPFGNLGIKTDSIENPAFLKRVNSFFTETKEKEKSTFWNLDQSSPEIGEMLLKSIFSLLASAQKG